MCDDSGKYLFNVSFSLSYSSSSSYSSSPPSFVVVLRPRLSIRRFSRMEENE
jgi:hypothetical protein